MRFRKEFIGDIRRGEKTEHRIPLEGRCRFRIGHFYAISRIEDVREELEDGTVAYKTVTTRLDDHVEVEGVRRQSTAHVSDSEALAEGFESADEWREWFHAEFGDHAEVWAITFHIAGDLPRLLSQRPGHDYTTSSFDAIRHEPEAVGREYLDRFAQEAESASALRREARSLSERVAELEASPETSGHQLASLRARIEQIEKRRNRKAA